MPHSLEEVCGLQGFVDLALLCTFKRMRDILGVKEEMKRASVPITMVQMVRPKQAPHSPLLVTVRTILVACCRRSGG